MSSSGKRKPSVKWRTRAMKLRRGYRRAMSRVRGQLSRRMPLAALDHWKGLSPYVLKFGPTSTGNSIRVYDDGDDSFEAQWAAIAKAKRAVWLEMYTLEPDKVGTRTLKELTEAARRGCEVHVIVDAVGSSTLREPHLAELRAAGGVVHSFNPLRSWRRNWPFLQRDHRKLLIVDHRLAFTGGMNISEFYAGKKYGNCNFCDCHVSVAGPAVRDLAGVFLRTWRRLTGQRRRTPRATRGGGASFVQVLRSDGYLHGRRSIQRAVRWAVRHARLTCYITNPYFVPPALLISAMIKAAKRGVDVRILTAGASDVPIVRLAGTHVYGRLLKHGVRIYEMTERMLHAKTASVDSLYASVGTFNLDQWSHKRNLEVNLAIFDPEIAGKIETCFLDNIRHAKEITMADWDRRSWLKRLLHWAAYHVMRL